MVNLTEAFSAIVTRIEKERGIEPAVSVSTESKDTFVAECLDLFVNVRKLQSVLEDLKPAYLLTTSTLDNAMSEEQRDELDMNARMELRKFDERLKHFEKYHELKKQRKRQSQHELSVNKHRDGILRSLKLELRETSKLLLEMQNTRLSRKQDINTGDFDGIRNIDYRADKYQPHLMSDEVVDRELDSLTQEQLQVLQQENSEILDAKLEDLAKVDQIHKSVVEIAQLESELASHLQVQSENIRSMVDDSADTETDISEGNKVLNKARRTKNRTTFAITLFGFTAGGLLILANWVKP